ncbi:roundabout homolog 1 isoform X2 [Polypterus senegalus]|uniref:roundabout homolog 1 isoform X2 n=1 Tax=Polypterus senegalus TaxID=55291 RepID=UPI001965212F|nr:roundabout homolog 1 isoform X2 [Polypterus senegalus]
MLLGVLILLLHCALGIHTWAEIPEQCQCRCTCPPALAPVGAGNQQRRHRQHYSPHRKLQRPHRRRGNLIKEFAPRIVNHPTDLVVQPQSPALLNCHSEGNPQPVIEWLHNGAPLKTERPGSQSQPILLPDGNLFFLQVVPGRRGNSDEGSYTCVAQNKHGKALSRNATLYVAALRDEFRAQPSDLEVAAGDPAILNCTAPKGHPEPNVTWKKDGVPLNRSSGQYSILNGRLLISHTQKNDSGAYVCIASNTVGLRESRVARLSVLEKPTFVQRPSNNTLKAGSTAYFWCQVEGDPMPVVRWQKELGQLPTGRYEVFSNHTLKIYYVRAQDTGKYTCTAANQVGSASVSAHLIVQENLDTGQREQHKELSSLHIHLENVTSQPLLSTTVRLMWEVQPEPHSLDGFEVLYRSLMPASSDWMVKKTHVERTTMIDSLKRGYKYEFKVRPFIGDLYGRESNSKHLRVPEQVPSASPQRVIVMVLAERNDTALVTWEPPPHEAHNGIIQSYQVLFMHATGQLLYNWTVDGGAHSLEIPVPDPETQYWIQVAAVNGAGIGVQSEPQPLFTGLPVPHNPPFDHLDQILRVVQDPVFIGSVGGVLWLMLMVAVICLYRRYSRHGQFKHGHCKATGLYRLASEDLIIKHRMAAPDSPWISSAWKSAPCGERYPSLWAQSKENPGFRKATLPLTEKEPCPLDIAVPIVPDSCGLYGTFYVDFSGTGLKTFNSPSRQPKVLHDPPSFSQPLLKGATCKEGQCLPWKQAVPAQPNMGILKESWEKRQKRQLHAVNSAPLAPTYHAAEMRKSAPATRVMRLCQNTAGGIPVSPNLISSPKILHYSASLQLIDMLPAHPSFPQIAEDGQSLSSEEGSSKSTKLTVDGGSLLSGRSVLGPRSPPAMEDPSYLTLSYSRLSTASFCLSLDEDNESALASQDIERFVELSPEAASNSPPDQGPASIPRPFSPTPTFGYICGPLPHDNEAEEASEDLPRLRHHFPAEGGSRRCYTPTSCDSEWEGSLWNGWGSISDGNALSARASLLSSSDGSFMNDASFARALAVAAETFGEGAFPDFSPPASPLSSLSLPQEPRFGKMGSLPVWDWSTAWVEEMEASYATSWTESDLGWGKAGAPGLGFLKPRQPQPATSSQPFHYELSQPRASPLADQR